MAPMTVRRHIQASLPESMHTELERAAMESERALAGQLRHYIRQGLRRDGYLKPADRLGDDEPERD